MILRWTALAGLLLPVPAAQDILGVKEWFGSVRVTINNKGSVSLGHSKGLRPKRDRHKDGWR